MSNRLRTRSRFWGGLTFDPSAQAIFAAFTTPPSSARQTQINTAVVALKAAGVWSLLDVLQVYAAADSQAATINWKQPGTYNATLVNSPVFTADRGIAGDGVASYVGTGFTPSTAVLPNFTTNSACFAVWRRAQSADLTPLAGSQNGTTRLVIRCDTGSRACRVNALSSYTAGWGPTQLGLLAINRPDAANAETYGNGTAASTVANGASGVPSDNVSLGFASATFNASQFSACVLGASLAAPQQAALYAALLAYLQAVGAV